MEKIQRLSMIALAMFAAACAQIEDPADSQTPDGENIIEFTANVATRTAIADDDKTASWVAGDQVKFVWEGGSTVVTASASGANTTFKVKVDESVEEVYAVYPADVCGGLSDGNLILDFSSQLSGGDFSKADISVAKAVKDGQAWNTRLDFKNAACILKIGVTTDYITRIQVQAVGEETIAGRLQVGFDEEGELVFGETTSDKSTVDMTVAGVGNYYVAVLPGVEMSEGFRVNCFKGEDAMTPFYYNGTFTTVRGQIIKLSEIESRLGQYYVTPEGTGTMTGQSWTNAMNVDAFKAFVTDQENHALLKGSTFHFSADEFSFGDDYLVLDYSEHADVAFTLEGTSTSEGQTVFLGRTNTTADNKAGVLWPQDNTCLTVKNVRFTGTNGKSNSAAIRITDGAKELTLENCVFDSNKTGSVALVNGATVLIKGCVFSNNGADGSAILVDHEDAVVKIENSVIEKNSGSFVNVRIINAKSFELIDSNIRGNSTYAGIYSTGVGTFKAERTSWTNNYAQGDSGTAAFIEGAGTYTFTDCEFVGNYADYRGGALCVSGSSTSAKLSVIGGKFEGNHTDGKADGKTVYAGGVINVSAPVTVDFTDVEFIENYSFVGSNTVAAGIIQLTNASATVRCNGCLFDGNYTNRSVKDNTHAAAVIDCRVDGAKYYFNACEFCHNTSGTGTSGNEQGGLDGTVIATRAKSAIAMNNCSFHDNYGGRDTDVEGLDPRLQWIYLGADDNTFILTNSSVIGDPCRNGGNVCEEHWSVIKLQNKGDYHFINNIICSNYTNGNCFWVAKDALTNGKISITSYYNKTSPEGDNRTNWGTDVGSGHDYYATIAYFGGLDGYIWNGSLLEGTNRDKMALTADVNAQIQNSDSDFYSWLSEIGALGKDINGSNRGATSWPGCYQAGGMN